MTFPPTPRKSFPIEQPIDCGISTQILPLSRLSLSSNNTSTPPNSSSSSPNEPSISNAKNKSTSKNMKMICEEKASKTIKKSSENSHSSSTLSNSNTREIQSGENQKDVEFHDTTLSPPIAPNNTLSSNASITNIVTAASPAGTVTDIPQLSSTTPPGKKISPVRDKLDRLKKSLTDPLLHYFQISPECEEEPDLLNTPRSLAPPVLSTINTMTISTNEIQSYGFIATEIDDESDEGKSISVTKKLFMDESIMDNDNQVANSSNDEGFSDNFKKEDSDDNEIVKEDNDENLPTPPPTPPPFIVTDM